MGDSLVMSHQGLVNLWNILIALKFLVHHLILILANIMIEYSYPECTTAVLLCLQKFTEMFPSYRNLEIRCSIAKFRNAIRKSCEYIKKCQRSDGSWYGSWGVCFTYATWFAIESLCSTGLTYDNE